jgi:hypothetical protein
MFLASQNPYFQRIGLRSASTALFTGSTSVFGTMEVHLWKSTTAAPGPDSVVGDFTECDFTGYAPVTPAFPGPPYNLDSNAGIGVQGDADFMVSGPVLISNNVAGYYVLSAGLGGLAFAEQFSAPVPMNNVGDLLSLDVIPALAFRTPTGA